VSVVADGESQRISERLVIVGGKWHCLKLGKRFIRGRQKAAANESVPKSWSIAKPCKQRHDGKDCD
jgi:hypothetical protein